MSNKNQTKQIELLCEVLGTEQCSLFVKVVAEDAAGIFEVGSTWMNNDTGFSYKVVGQRPAGE